MDVAVGLEFSIFRVRLVYQIAGLIKHKVIVRTPLFGGHGQLNPGGSLLGEAGRKTVTRQGDQSHLGGELFSQSALWVGAVKVHVKRGLQEIIPSSTQGKWDSVFVQVRIISGRIVLSQVVPQQM